MQSLLQHNTFGIERFCKALYQPQTIEELKDLLLSLAKEPLLVIGGGSNLLLTKDFEGNVLRVAIKGIEVRTDDKDQDSVYMRCGAGETWDDVIAYAINHGYYNMENMSLIPGEVGASAVQNVGAYGVEAKDVIHTIEVIEIATGNVKTINNEDCAYAYRYSRFKNEWKGQYVVTHVTYKLSKIFTPKTEYGNLKNILEKSAVSEPTAMDVRQAVIKIRQEKLPDPKEEGNAGSFFMNPVISETHFQKLIAKYPDMPYYTLYNNNGEIDAHRQYKIPAGWMIEKCGWKGKTMGRAGVHSKQALVLVNKGGASGEEVLNLCNAIVKDVKEKFEIELHPEVNII